MSASEAAIAAARSASSSSSVSFFVVPFADFDCDCGTKPVEALFFTSSKLISSARLRSASKLSSTRALRGCIELWYNVF